MLKASVSNIELFRTWRDSEELGLDWLLQRILRHEQTDAMRCGEAFHKALETAGEGDVDTIHANGYRFHFPNDCTVEIPRLRELPIQKQYGDLLVRGRVDSVTGWMVTDYKSTQQFDPDRLMTGYQWRYYLDMLVADVFRWEVFVLREADDPMTFAVTEVHRLEQRRYPLLHSDCEFLAGMYEEFAKEHLECVAEGDSELARQLRESIREAERKKLDALTITDADVAVGK